MNRVTSFLYRKFVSDNVLIPIFAIIMGLVFGAIIMLLAGYNPIRAYSALLDGVFGNIYNVGESLRAITPLIFTGLAVAFAFRTGLFNIGVEGQFVVGALGAVWIGITLDGLPMYIHAPLAVLMGGIFGAIWGIIPGLLKAWRGVHEVITTIMMNWIALYFTNYWIRYYLKGPSERSERVQDSALLYNDWLRDTFEGARLHTGIFVALLMAFVFYLILWKTRTGYELRAVGFNPDAAEYAGMNVKANIVKAMVISGFIAGLGGASEALGVYGYWALNAGLPGFGFDGIAVALIGTNGPIGVVLAAMLFGALKYGANTMDAVAKIPPEMIKIIIASVIFFVAASPMVKAVIKALSMPFKKLKGKKQGDLGEGGVTGE
ncbi:ABC transporter permease [Rubeoparvulum massiliense]|uniref:ABC transporter permease n=1 Tax=Rubeoparvulum massiliense TaxID=1631346 RepID=UPI00065DCC4C|nr:ABC transporter permease [Rubeoparvulum massiliense]